MNKYCITSHNLIDISAIESERQKNVQFSADTHSWHYKVPADRDPTFGAANTTDSIQDFMSRPVLVYQAELPIQQTFSATFNPWKLFFENPRVNEKLKNFRNLRCDLKIKLVVNGNPFYYGSYIMYYRPLHLYDSRTTDDPTTAALVQLSQMPHVYIDPCEGTGGELTVPYFNNRDAMNIIDGDWDQMGEIGIRSIFPLRHSNDNTQPIDISVFVMAQNVELSTPTSRQRVLIENQADEYGKPSFIAHSIAKAAGWLTDFPVIGRYARATQMIATSAGEVASMFGYSRPRLVDESASYRNRPAANLAVTNIPDNVTSLAVDAKKEITIDPRVTGLQSTDEMALVPIAKREAYVTTFPWNESAGADTHLFSIRVSPMQGDISGFDQYLTPSAFVALPFRYWRGSMRFRFNIIASKYHRGRLKFVWDPEYNDESSASNYNSNYITLVDINQQKDVVMDIGWGSHFSYLETGGLNFPFFSLNPYSSSSRWANGTLSVFVVNSLTSPGPTQSDVGVAVFSSACDDFEVACPDSLFLDGDLSVRSTPLPPPPDLPPQQGDDGGGTPTLPPVPVDPTPPPDPGGEEETTLVPDGIGLGNRRLWPNPPMNQGVRVERTTGVADVPGGAVGSIFMVPSFEGSLEASVYSELAVTVTINLFAADGTTLIDTANVLMLAQDTTPMLVSGDSGDQTQPYFYVQIVGTEGANELRIVDLQIPGVVFQKLTAEDMNARLLSGPLTFDEDGAAEVSPLNATDKLLLDVPPGLTSENYPVVHYMLEGTSGAVHKYNGVNRAPGADSLYKFAVADTLFYDSPGVMALVFDSPKTIAGAILMYYPNVEDQAMENQAEEGESVDHASAPVAESTDTTMAPYLPGMETNAVYFGEQITSWRQVLKRYETVTTFTPEVQKFRWFDSFNELASGPSLDTTRLNMIDYVKSAYVGKRGGMRLKILPLTELSSAGTIVISNQSDSTRTSEQPRVPNWSGSSFDPLVVTGAADAEIPYYSNMRFFLGRMGGDSYSGEGGRNPRLGLQKLEAEISIHGAAPSARYALAHSIAEDYSLHFFLSAPVLNYTPPPVVNPPFG